MMIVTQKAADKIAELMKNEDDLEKHVRLNLDSVTWGGPSISLALEEPGNYIGDERFSANNMTIVYENSLSRYFEGKVLDYTPGHHGSEFKVNDFRPGE